MNTPFTNADGCTNILSSLKIMKENMPKAMQRLAVYILENANQAVESNISEIALAANVGEATVVRFARMLGFPGFQEFKIELAVEVSNQQKKDDLIVDSQIEDDDTPLTISKKVSNAIHNAIAENIELLNDKQAKQVVQSLVKARKILIIGMGNSGLCALYLKNKLVRIGLNAIADTNVHFSYTAASLLEPDDVCITISQRGHSKESNKVFAIAKDAGATTVLITHEPDSNLARESDYVFYSGNQEGYMQGDSLATITSQLHICEVLYIMLVQLNPQRAYKIKQITLKALSSFNEID